MKSMAGSSSLRRLKPEKVTAEAKTENVVAARQAGVNNYIIKPFNLAVLRHKLAAVPGEL